MKSKTQPMTAAEAQRRTENYRRGGRDQRARLLALKEDEVHKAMGYSTWEGYVQAEFGYERSYAFRLIQAARIERELEGRQLATDGLTESKARVLAKIAHDHGEKRMAEVAKRAIREGGFGALTARRLEEVRDEVVAAEARHLLLAGLPERLHETARSYRALLTPLREAEVPDDLDWIGGAEVIEKAIREIDAACILGIGIGKHLREVLGLPERSRAPEPEDGTLGDAI